MANNDSEISGRDIKISSGEEVLYKEYVSDDSEAGDAGIWADAEVFWEGVRSKGRRKSSVKVFISKMLGQ
jgi:hypothetical protein